MEALVTGNFLIHSIWIRFIGVGGVLFRGEEKTGATRSAITITITIIATPVPVTASKTTKTIYSITSNNLTGLQFLLHYIWVVALRRAII